MHPLSLRLSLWLALLCLAACSDDKDDGPQQPTPDAGRYPGPLDPCEVQAPPPQDDPTPISLANARRPVTLPSARAGQSRAYSARIPGTTASNPISGALPDGLSLDRGTISGLVSPSAVDPGQRVHIHTFTLSPDDPGASHLIEVSLAVYPAEEVRPPAAPAYWEAGPYPVWNTQPLEVCPQNPVIPLVGDQPDVDLYMVYPTVGEPTETGEGPVAEGRWPVIVFAHANNDRVCDINEKYLSLHDHWASWGFIVVAVDGTFTNCNRGTKQNIELRSEGQLSALTVLDQLNADPTSRFFGRVDLDRIVLAGHSRGGGANFVSALADDRIRALIDLQGVDMTSFGFGSDPLPPLPVIGLTAGEDVDLNYPIVEPTEDQLSGLYTWVNVNGGIHAYTADTAPIEPDDVPLIRQQQQHDITEYFTTAFLARFVGVGDGTAATPFAPDPRADAVLFSDLGARTVDAEISELGVFVRWNRRLATGLLIDDFDGPQNGSPLSTNALGGENRFEGFEEAREALTYLEAAGGRRPQVYQKATSLLLIASAGTTGVYRAFLSPDGDPVALDGGNALQARIKGPESGPVGTLEVEIETPQGAAKLGAFDFIGPEALDNRFTQLRIPLGAFDGLEGSPEITSVAFYLSSGSVYIDDLRID